MEKERETKNHISFVQCQDVQRGDNVAFKRDNWVYMVDDQGELYSRVYSADIFSDLTSYTTNILYSLSSLKKGQTYTIVDSDIVVGKYLGVSIFGREFLSIDSTSHVAIVDVPEEEMENYLYTEKVKEVLFR